MKAREMTYTPTIKDKIFSKILNDPENHLDIIRTCVIDYMKWWDDEEVEEMMGVYVND